MFYDYLCRQCGYRLSDEHYVPTGDYHKHKKCKVCGGRLQRAVLSVSIVKGMDWNSDSHFNNSVGAPVQNLWDFREQLKRKAEEQTLATGIEHNYDVIDPRDRDFYNIVDTQYEVNKAVNEGYRPELDQTDEEVDNEAQWGDPDPLDGESVLDGGEIR